MTEQERQIRAIRQAYNALGELSNHPAFEHICPADPPEFAKGGVGYEAHQALGRILFGSA